MQDTALPPGPDQPDEQVRSRYRVPRDDRAVLLLPPPLQTAQSLRVNEQFYNYSEQLVWGKPLRQWRSAARRESVNRANCFTSHLDNSPCSASSLIGPIIAAGHQPELFHPGVWLKNLWAGKLAQQQHGVAINLVVDSDTVKSRTVPVPHPEGSALRFRRVLIDDWQIGLPWQQLQVVNEALFRSFPDRLLQESAGLISAAGVLQFWDAVQSYRQRDDCLVSAFTYARRQMEQELGVHNLELPLSQVCQTETFWQFIAGICFDSSRFADVYNHSLQQYRALYGLRSTTHPMPDLTNRDDWQEIPFWGWTESSPRRVPLFIRRSRGQLELSDGGSLAFQSDLPAFSCQEEVAKILRQWSRTGLQIRPRALMTTLYFRLFVSDWFIHGIGGAKYDEITDRIIEKYFSLPAPALQVATGTYWLPELAGETQPSASGKDLQQKLRYAHENPETLLAGTGHPQLQLLLQQKAELVNEQQQQLVGLTKKERRARRPTNKKRHQKFQEIRQKLKEISITQFTELQNQYTKSLRQEANALVVQHREYPFLFYSRPDRQHMAEMLNELIVKVPRSTSQENNLE